MFYSFIRYVTESFPSTVVTNWAQTNYLRATIDVGPHRTWWEPPVFALAGRPRKFVLCQKRAFQESYFTLILVHANAFSVDRDHPVHQQSKHQ